MRKSVGKLNAELLFISFQRTRNGECALSLAGDTSNIDFYVFKIKMPF